MSLLKHDWTTPTSSCGGFGPRPRPHAIKILPALHEDVLHRDGWARDNLARVIVELETRLNPRVFSALPAFVRSRTTAAHPEVGRFRTDPDGGTCTRVQGFQLSHAYRSAAGLPVASLSQIDRREGWHRHATGDFLTLERAESGRYDLRPPTNRKRKRERCKGLRRERLDALALALHSRVG